MYQIHVSYFLLHFMSFSLFDGENAFIVALLREHQTIFQKGPQYCLKFFLLNSVFFFFCSGRYAGCVSSEFLRWSCSSSRKYIRSHVVFSALFVWVARTKKQFGSGFHVTILCFASFYFEKSLHNYHLSDWYYHPMTLTRCSVLCLFVDTCSSIDFPF
jgi:hypothetical protein